MTNEAEEDRLRQIHAGAAALKAELRARHNEGPEEFLSGRATGPGAELDADLQGQWPNANELADCAVSPEEMADAASRIKPSRRFGDNALPNPEADSNNSPLQSRPRRQPGYQSREEQIQQFMVVFKKPRDAAERLLVLFERRVQRELAKRAEVQTQSFVGRKPRGKKDRAGTHLRGLPPGDLLQAARQRGRAPIVITRTEEEAVIPILLVVLRDTAAAQALQPRRPGRSLDVQSLIETLEFLQTRQLPLRSSVGSQAVRELAKAIGGQKPGLANPEQAARARLRRLTDLRHQLGFSDPPPGRR